MLPGESAARRLAAAFWIATVALAALAFVASAGRSLQIGPPEFLPPLAARWLGDRLFVPLGVAAAAVVLAGRGRRDAIRGAFLLSPRVRGALRISIALSYLGFEIGKLTHEAEMRAFFADSGLPVWMNHAVMAAETVMAAALFLPATEIAAAAGLSLILLGAIATHAHDRDPFSDSLDALHLLVLLAGFAVLTLASRGRKAGTSEAPLRA